MSLKSRQSFQPQEVCISKMNYYTNSSVNKHITSGECYYTILNMSYWIIKGGVLIVFEVGGGQVEWFYKNHQ